MTEIVLDITVSTNKGRVDGGMVSRDYINNKLFIASLFAPRKVPALLSRNFGAHLQTYRQDCACK